MKTTSSPIPAPRWLLPAVVVALALVVVALHLWAARSPLLPWERALETRPSHAQLPSFLLGRPLAEKLILSAAGQDVFGLPRLHLLGAAVNLATFASALWLLSGWASRALNWSPARSGVFALIGSFWWLLHPMMMDGTLQAGQLPQRIGVCAALLALGAYVRSWEGSWRQGWMIASAILVVVTALIHEIAFVVPWVALVLEAVRRGTSWSDRLKSHGIFFLVAGGAAAGVLLRTAGASAEHATLLHGLSPVQWLAHHAAQLVAFAQGLVLPERLPLDSPLRVTGTFSLASGLAFALVIVGVCWAVWSRRSAALVLVLPSVLLVTVAGPFLVLGHPASSATYAIPALVVISLVAAGVARLPFLVSMSFALLVGAVLSLFSVQRAKVQSSPDHFFTAAFQRDPTNARLWIMKAEWVRAAGRTEEADAALARAVDILRSEVAAGDLNPVTRRNLGLLLLQKPEGLVEAKRIFSYLTKQFPKSGPDFVSLGNACYYSPNGRAEAVDAYRRAVELMPHDPGAKLNLGSTLAELPKRREEGFAMLREMIKVTPDYIPTYIRLSVILAKTSLDWTEPEALLRAALKRAPADAAVHYHLALLRSMQKDGVDEALVHYKEAVRLKPDYIEARYNLALNLLKAKGDRAHALAEFEEILRIDPKNEMAQHMVDRIAKEVVAEAISGR